MSGPRILLIENGYIDLIKSRIPLGAFFIENGCSVKYACPNSQDKFIFNIPMSRSSLAPLELLSSSYVLWRYEKENNFDVVMSFRLIPNFLSFISSFFNYKVTRIFVITGLGYPFIKSKTSLSRFCQRFLISIFYKLASKRGKIITQNSNDLHDLGIRNGTVILGSGVTPIETNNVIFQNRKLIILFAGRLLRSKGILKVILMFKAIKVAIPHCNLLIAGTIDGDNPDSISEIELENIKRVDGVEYVGYVADMNTLYSNANVVLFPSSYREGIPRVLIEALKYGLTIITTDSPGCRETVDANGLLIPNETVNYSKVVDYLKGLNQEDLLKNRRNSQKLFRLKFSSEVIYPQYLDSIYSSSKLVQNYRNH